MSQYTVFLILAPLAATFSTGVAIYAWRTHASRETKALMWLIVAIAGWLTTNTLELAAPTEAGTIFWAKAGYLFVTSTAVAWLVFALRYTDKDEWLTPTRLVLVCAIPFITINLVMTNEAHTLVWRVCTFVPVKHYLALHVDHGPWFWVNVIYEYLLVILGALLIVRQSFKSFSLYRQQSIWLVAGAVTPIVANMIYAFHLIPGLDHDFTSVSFALAGLAFAMGMLRHRLFDLQPIAREAVIDSMNDAMFALDMQNRVVDLNPAAQQLIGQPANVVLGQPAAQIFSRWKTLVGQFQDTTDIQTDVSINHDGPPAHYDLRISLLTDRRGQVTGRLIVLRDITDRKEAEVALRERTSELEVRNEQLDMFAHTVAHDIKDPLTAIVGYSGILSEFAGRLTLEDEKRYLEMVISTSDKLANIVDALLLLASVHRLSEYDTYAFDMGRITVEARDRLAHFIQENGATMIMQETWPTVESYAPWIEEIWVNYISNAVKYGGNADEGIPPRVELGADAPQDETIRFWVKDNGPGLTTEQQSQLFNQFTRLRGSPSEGHGLGLSIVRNILRKLGGEAGVESEIGQGSTFWFTLPVAPDKKGH